MAHSLASVDQYILQHLDPLDLLSIPNAIPSLADSAKSVRSVEWNIDNFLERFFDPGDVAPFRTWQEKADAIISGSAALQFFERSSYVGSDIDVYVDCRRFDPDEFKDMMDSVGYDYNKVVMDYANEPMQRVGDTELEPLTYDSFSNAFHDIVTPALHRIRRIERVKGKSHIFLSNPNLHLPRNAGRRGNGIIGVFEFVKRGSTPEKRFQLIISSLSPLDLVFNFHSSKSIS